MIPFKKKKHNIILYSGIVLAAIVAFIACDQGSRWEKVTYQKVKESFTVSGNVETLNKSDIKAPLTGRIVKIYFEEGDKVNKGDLLATYEKEIFTAKVKNLIAGKQQASENYNKLASGYRIQEIQSAKANYENQNALYKEKKLAYEKLFNDKKRNTELYNKEMLTPKEYEDYLKDLEIAKSLAESQKYMVDSAQSTYNMLKSGYRKEDVQAAKSSVVAANAEIEEARTVYEKTDILSPVTGTITEKVVQVSDNVNSGDLLFKVTSKTDLEIKALIEEEDIRNIAFNDEVKIVLDAYPTITLTGNIKAIYDKVEKSTRLLPVKIFLKNVPGDVKLLPGMTTSCTFSGHEINYLTVPEKALQKDGKKYYVQTRHGNVYLEVGKQHNDRVLVQGDITDKDEVLVK